MVPLIFGHTNRRRDDGRGDRDMSQLPERRPGLEPRQGVPAGTLSGDRGLTIFGRRESSAVVRDGFTGNLSSPKAQRSLPHQTRPCGDAFRRHRRSRRGHSAKASPQGRFLATWSDDLRPPRTAAPRRRPRDRDMSQPPERLQDLSHPKAPLQPLMCPRSDSNRHCADFKSAASAIGLRGRATGPTANARYNDPRPKGALRRGGVGPFVLRSLKLPQ